MPYNESSLVKLSALKQLAQRTKSEIDIVAGVAASAIKFVSTSGNTVSFFTSSDGTGTAAFTVDFPSEMFLDAARTTFIPNFAFNAQTYPGATNPSLEGKPVLVLAVKTTTDAANGTVNDTISYSFLDMASLVDTYTVKAGDSEKILTISGYEVEVHISQTANNALSVQNDGLYVDISGKADKVASATAGNLAGLDANGNLTDSGSGIATAAEVTEVINEVFGAPASNGD